MHTKRRHDAGRLRSRFFFALVACASTFASAQLIPVSLPGLKMTFDTASSVTNWRALSVGFDSGAGVITTASQLDSQVQLLSVDNLLGNLPTVSGWPPPQFNYACYSSTAQCIYSRPGNNWCAVFAVGFSNASGSAIQTLGISFDLGAGALTQETVPGFRVYYSLTGQSNGWTAIEPLSTGTTGVVSAVVSLVPNIWHYGATLYLLWADDNGPGSPDGYYTLDNVALTLQPKLRVQQVGATELEFSWPAGWDNCFLQSTTNIPSQNWNTHYNLRTCTNGICRERMPITGQAFYRLGCYVLIP